MVYSQNEVVDQGVVVRTAQWSVPRPWPRAKVFALAQGVLAGASQCACAAPFVSRHSSSHAEGVNKALCHFISLAK